MSELFVTRAIFPSQKGGVSTAVYDLARSYGDVEVVSSDLGISTENKDRINISYNTITDNDGVKVIFHPSNLGFPVSMGYILWLFKNLRSYELIHFHSLFAPLSLLGILICSLMRYPFVVYPHGELLGPALSIKPFKKKLTLKFFSYFIKKAKAFVVTSPIEFDSVNKFFSNRVIITSNAFNFTEPRRGEHIGDYFLYIGRLHEIKNLDILINSYQLYRNSTSNPKPLIIAGDDKSQFARYLKSIVDDEGIHGVEFIGHVEDKKKYDLYRNATATFLVSKSENFGNVVVESLGVGTPVVVSDGTPWESVEINQCGFYVKQDLESIKNAMLKFSVIDSTSYSKMVNSAVSFARSNFSVANVVPKLKSELQSL